MSLWNQDLKLHMCVDYEANSASGIRDDDGNHLLCAWRSKSDADRCFNLGLTDGKIAPTIVEGDNLLKMLFDRTVHFLIVDPRPSSRVFKDSFSAPRLKGEELVDLRLPEGKLNFLSEILATMAADEETISFCRSKCAEIPSETWMSRLSEFIAEHQRRMSLKSNSPKMQPEYRWHGQMTCNRCNYVWQSRRSTPPARCPRCSAASLTMNIVEHKSGTGCLGSLVLLMVIAFFVRFT